MGVIDSDRAATVALVDLSPGLMAAPNYAKPGGWAHMDYPVPLTDPVQGGGGVWHAAMEYPPAGGRRNGVHHPRRAWVAPAGTAGQGLSARVDERGRGQREVRATSRGGRLEVDLRVRLEGAVSCEESWTWNGKLGAMMHFCLSPRDVGTLARLLGISERVRRAALWIGRSHLPRRGVKDR